MYYIHYGVLTPPGMGLTADFPLDPPIIPMDCTATGSNTYITKYFQKTFNFSKNLISKTNG